MSNKYKPSFGIKRENRKIKSIKGEQGIGFKLTNDGNYDIDNKRLTNIADPSDNKDAINKGYFENASSNLLVRGQDIDMNNKTIKNLSWPHDNNDAVPKKYLYQYGLLFDSKSSSFNAKDKKIVKALDPEDQQDVATKNYVDEKINFTAMFYPLELSSIATPYLDIVDKLRLIQVSSHMWLLIGMIKPKIAFTIGNQVLITQLPIQFPKPAQAKYFTYYKKKGLEHVNVEVGFITLQNELHLFLPLELQDMIIFDSIIFIL